MLGVLRAWLAELQNPVHVIDPEGFQLQQPASSNRSLCTKQKATRSARLTWAALGSAMQVSQPREIIHPPKVVIWMND
jgi:hypothetical protein